jgi:hypothetical protein
MTLDERETDNALMGGGPIESLASCLEEEAEAGIWAATDIATTKAAMVKAATILRDLQKFVAMIARLPPPDEQEECDPEDSSEALSGLIAMARRLVSANTDG